jgi:uncharacterized protein (DUF2164 family)
VPKLTATVALTPAQYALIQQAATGAGMPNAEALVAQAIGIRLGAIYRERGLDAMRAKVEGEVAALAASVRVITDASVP